MKKEPFVSVIIPTYQCKQFVSLAVDSVLAKTLEDFGIIFVDYDSTDNTQVAFQKYSMMENINNIRQLNRGSAARKNFPIHAPVVRRECVADVNGFDETLSTAKTGTCGSGLSKSTRSRLPMAKW